MGKLLIKTGVMVVVMLGISNYGFYLMTGKSPFSNIEFPSLSKPNLEDINPLSKGTETAYKWTDDEGVVHYSQEAPPQENVAERIEVDPDTNLIRGLEASEAPEEDTANAITPVEGPIYKPENIQKIINDAKNVEKVLQGRHENQEQIINNL